jgi:TrmH family RNA methyltransferase
VIPPRIVLVRPSRPANVGAACRAMKNMGAGDLRLVGAPVPKSDAEARALAYGAWDVLDAAREEPTLAAAVSGCGLVVGTSGRANSALSPREAATRALAEAGDRSVAVVFGGEASGLRRDELELCALQVRIPTAAEHASLNLAQAVLVVCYELFVAREVAAPGPPPQPHTRAAPVEAVEAALADWTGALVEIGYLATPRPGRIMAELRRLLARARPTDREITLLRGMARQIRWAGRASARVPTTVPQNEALEP